MPPSPSYAIIAAMVSSALLGAKPTEQASPWLEGLQFDYSSAVHSFETLPATPATLIGRASALLSSQPQTEGNIRQADSLLMQVQAQTSPDSSEHLWATYLLARIEQDHLSSPDLQSATTRYQALVNEHPGTPAADQAAVQLAMIWFAGAQTDAIRPALDRIQSLLDRVASDGAKRDLHYILGISYWRDLHDAPAALSHLIAMRAYPDHISGHAADMDLIIAGIARESGDTGLALKHYRSFLEQLPRNIRSGTVRKIVAELESSAPAPHPVPSAR